ncbi:uncharacterized protein EI97DRAFT_437242 [Westerdykella ornata]|uniref:Uncharacterized protein n=1 Tax=Westerdykella ornata TaxID=318751 RepID=A0A6A6J650_WESOR|nr:uncharacterized protein EI97DRAFT_437242 [Westerdykella ornata]KAF2272060.1 hypothetical protein EI97DRAFT_437242 [Westerdykella ornata]
MRLSALHFLAFTSLAAAQYPSRPRAPGIAFRLTHDYGVAAIYLENGTSVPVAQVYGSPGYQEFMRKNNTSASPEASKFCQLRSQAIDRLPSAATSKIDICRNADVIHTKALLSTLQAATESYLGTNICHAALILDDVSKHKVNVAHEALAALGLYQVLPTVQASKSFALAHRPKDAPAFDEKPWPVLVIDFSIHWFNIGLYTIGELGIVDPVEGYVRGPTTDEENQLDALRDTLSHIFAHPPADMRLPEELRHLIVYGDDANNDEFRRILAAALRNVQLPTQQTRNVLSSIFDGPAYTAYTAHVRMDTPEFETHAPSAFGCKWRSKLYSEDQTELST